MSPQPTHRPMPQSPREPAAAPYRASLVKRRPAPEPEASPPATGEAHGEARAPAAPVPSEGDRAAEIAAEHARRVAAETRGVRRIEAMTSAWNDELASTVPAVAAIVGRAVRAIVGEAPREDVVVSALHRELARVRSDHRPVLRVARADGAAWVQRLRERAGAGGQGSGSGSGSGSGAGEPAFDVRADDALAAGKCVLEIGARRVDLTPEAQLDAFDDHLRTAVGALPPREPPALPDVPIASRPAAHDDGPIVVAAPGEAAPAATAALRVAITRTPPPRPAGRSASAEGADAIAQPAATNGAATGAEDAPENGAERATGITPAAADAKAKRGRDTTASDAAASSAQEGDAKDALARDGKAKDGKANAVAADRPAFDAPKDPTGEAPSSRPERTDAIPADGGTSAEDVTNEGAAAEPPAGALPEADVASVRNAADAAPEGDAGDAGPDDDTAPGSQVSPRSDTTPASDELDFDALDLGEGAARFESRPAPDADRPAPWIGAVVSAPGLARAGAEGGGSRAVAALRERVAHTAGTLRREVAEAETRDERWDMPVTPEREDAPIVDGAGREAVPTGGAIGTVDAKTPWNGMVGEPSGKPDDGRDDDLPPFTRGARHDPALDPGTGDELVADEKDEGSRRRGDAVRRAFSGEGHRAARPRAADNGADPASPATSQLPDAPATGEPSRLPPRIAELIAKRRAAR